MDNMLIQNIKENCKDILSIYKDTIKAKKRFGGGTNNFLWRGLGADRGEVVSSQIQGSDVTGNDITKFIRKIFDNILIKEYDCIATRSNSIMCSSYGIANNYGGCPYVIFPVDGCSYTWFEKQESSYILFHIEESFEDIISNFNYESEYDYFFDDRYYENMSKELQEQIKTAIENTTRSLKPSKTNLMDGIQLQNEFLITGEKYYSIRCDVIDDIFPKLID